MRNHVHAAPRTAVRSSLRALLVLSALALPAFAVAGTDALRIASADGDWSLRLGGRLQADAALIDPSGAGSFTDQEFRRARLNLSGRAGDWRFRYEHDVAADKGSGTRDAWAGYFGMKRIALRAGHLQEPVSLEELTSSRATTFAERALPNALVPGYNWGVLADTRGKRWNASFGVFDGSPQDGAENIDSGRAVAARAVFRPLQGRKRLLHLGASAVYRQAPEDARLRLGARPEVHVLEQRLVSTGTVSQVDDSSTAGLEFAALRGPFSLQGEYLRTAVDRHDRESLAFDGWYLAGSWFIAGGRRAYDRDDAAFGAVKPRGRHGAWELALRRSELDLQDGAISGGRERNWTLGLNWYVNDSTRLMLNLVDAKARPDRDGNDERVRAALLRVEFAF